MNDQAAPSPWIGPYVLVPNPCTTEPCLPGMAAAIECQGTLYFLAQHGQWLKEGFSLAGWSPAPGDGLCVRGTIHKQRDLHGEPFLLLEVEAMSPVSLPP